MFIEEIAMGTSYRSVVRGALFAMRDSVFETESGQEHVLRAAYTFFGENEVTFVDKNVFVVDGYLLTLRSAPSAQRMEDFQKKLHELELELGHLLEL